ncbi:MAG: hypothetical protein ABI587_04530 [Gemmatimonadales bacterium]
MPLLAQAGALFLLALPIACVAWSVTHEEIFREPREYCLARSESDGRWFIRKFFYVFTCEYCFSHWVTLALLGMTRFQLVYLGWRGYLIGGFALVWVANQYMSIFARLRLDIKRERLEVKQVEKVVDSSAPKAS